MSALALLNHIAADYPELDCLHFRQALQRALNAGIQLRPEPDHARNPPAPRIPQSTLDFVAGRNSHLAALAHGAISPAEYFAHVEGDSLGFIATREEYLRQKASILELMGGR